MCVDGDTIIDWLRKSSAFLENRTVSPRLEGFRHCHHLQEV
jgi:hypothetical protein